MDYMLSLHEAIWAYLGGELTAWGLQDHLLAELTTPIVYSNDEQAKKLSAAMLLFLSEHGYGHRTDEELREALLELSPVRPSAPAGS